MIITRRQLAVASTFVLGASALVPVSSSFAESADAASIAEAVAALTKAMLAADKPQLEALVADQLSYGHSGGVIQNKAEFIDVIASKKTVYKSIALSDQTVAFAGDNAIVRHAWSSESESDGKTTMSKIGVLQVWQKQGGNWKLLARQAFKV
jgi:ketosteroid isomerase-like protein